ncbi:3-ketoacyl-ACP reductase [Sulfolobales archaeon HS-7]|nr:3-ketoacyl-ACP reductase [Sulfolobales archaeon HS-7]
MKGSYVMVTSSEYALDYHKFFYSFKAYRVMLLNGKRVLILGVSTGFGFALGYLASKEGASVILNSRNEIKLKDISSKVPNSTYIAADVSTYEGCKTLSERVGELDGVVIAVGGYVEDSIENPSGLEEMLTNHVKVPINCMRALANNIRRGGSIVLVSSMRGLFTSEDAMSYSVAMAGTAKLVEKAASEFLIRGVRVNGVAPSWIDGDFVPNRDYRKLRNLGDPKAPPEDFAKVTIWLLSEDSEWVNGVVVPLDGGNRLKS